ncbi:MAG TPA: hypothetical protein PKX79_07850 [Spirochaetota bacterium]|nr:hypothetical protein [Spirochaetota bacterium]HOK92488.1 hypothetical protein [Spirochaetota bacterium]HON15489.1 hypothetical protein [Spirochaetota bacterium]HPD78116.1 hypothetical protein [Spirochaetota bacterium]HPP95278.1 hypothetical protein [Spirochaetota bacterium]
MRFQLFVSLFFIAVFLSLTSCMPDNTSTVHVSWDPLSDPLVNREGGGYIVFCSKRENFNFDDFSGKTIPYRSGEETPTTVSLDVENGCTWCFAVAGYFKDEDGTVTYGAPSEVVCVHIDEE